MKKHIIGLILLAGLMSPAMAATSTASTSTGGTSFGLGLSTFGTGALTPSTPAMSASLEFGNLMSLQILAGIMNSDPFEFGFGSLFRYTLFGTNNLGWNVGFGFNLGTVGVTGLTNDTKFFMNLLLPTTGIKFSIFPNVKLSFDGGVQMHLTPSPFRMYLSPLNGWLGAAIHYYFN